jgi:hypothetical protein
MTAPITSGNPVAPFAAPTVDLWPKAGNRSWPNGQVAPEEVAPNRATLEALYQQAPEAALLVLQSYHLRLQRQHGAFDRIVAAYEAPGPVSASGDQPSVVNDAIDQVVKIHEVSILKPVATATSIYTKYVTALSQMLTEIQGLQTAESNGNSHMHGPKMLERIAAFIAEWHGKPTGTLGAFDSEQAAQELASQFKAGTVKTVKVAGGLHAVVISVEPLKEVLKAMANSDENAAHLAEVITELAQDGQSDGSAVLTAAELLERFNTVITPPNSTFKNEWIEMKKTAFFSNMSDSEIRDYLLTIKLNGWNELIAARIAREHRSLIQALQNDPKHFTNKVVTTREGGVSPQIMQAFGLAADDVRKTHDTDANLLMDHYRRSLGEYNNRLKMVSSMISALSDTFRMATSS